MDALQIGKGSLYHAFGSKRALFERALTRYRRYQDDAIAAALDRPGPVRDRIRAGLTFLVETNFGGVQPRGCLAVNTAAELAGADEGAAAQVLRSFERTESAFRAVLEEGRRTGELDADLDPAATASLLLATTVGIQLIARTATGPDRLHRIVDAALAHL